MNLSFLSRLDDFKEIISKTDIDIEHDIFKNIDNGIQKIFELLSDTKKNNSNVYIIGNGGSAGVAAHATTDFFNVANIRATTLHESSLLTCMTNDYGYENAFMKMISLLIKKEDILIAISSSGQSKNILNAVIEAKKINSNVITLSGFSSNNPLRKMGNINIWIDSNDYGFVEIGHQFILHNIADKFNPKFN